jgi:hypothetical protein
MVLHRPSEPAQLRRNFRFWLGQTEKDEESRQVARRVDALASARLWHLRGTPNKAYGDKDEYQENPLTRHHPNFTAVLQNHPGVICDVASHQDHEHYGCGFRLQEKQNCDQWVQQCERRPENYSANRHATVTPIPSVVNQDD